MKKICVFCGSSPGSNPDFVQTARALGRTLAEKGLTLVYGGGDVGLMGQLARSVLDRHGKVIGVIPKALYDKEVALNDLPDLRVVGTMHQRKALMAELSDGFIALPGGLGTIEEFFEALTWSQLGIHSKPCGLLNVLGYYDRLLEFLDDAVRYNFVHRQSVELILVADKPCRLIKKMTTFKSETTDKAAWALDLNKKIEF